MSNSNTPNKPREFWILPQKGAHCEWTNLYPDESWKSESKPLICVIEKTEEVKRAVENYPDAIKVLKAVKAMFDNDFDIDIQEIKTATYNQIEALIEKDLK